MPCCAITTTPKTPCRRPFNALGNTATAWMRSRTQRRARPGVVALEELSEIAELRACGISAEELASNRQLKALADAYIQRLPAKLRQPLLLSTVEELSAREIGQMLGIPEASVRTRCLRARRLLQEKLGVALEK